MKAYIHNPITIKKPRDVHIEIWRSFVVEMKEFNDKFSIFNKGDDEQLIIEVQKISLEEKDMCYFLNYLDEVVWDEFDAKIIFKFKIEIDRICVEILTH